MNRNGLVLIEIMVGVLILAIAGLAVTATMVMVSSKEMRGVGGSLDLQALGYAKTTLEELRNAVSTDATRGVPLVVSATSYNTTSILPASFTSAPINGTRTYLVSSIPGTDLKKVKVTVQWND
jgi:hypothetical protein